MPQKSQEITAAVAGPEQRADNPSRRFGAAVCVPPPDSMSGGRFSETAFESDAIEAHECVGREGCGSVLGCRTGLSRKVRDRSDEYCR
jgi:hypothetical protein